MRRSIKQFVASLVDADLPIGFRNPYDCPTAARNLERFLSTKDPKVSRFLLVGEAPGYRGAATSGVAFCSLSILLDDWGDPWRAFGSSSGYDACSSATFWREATATALWSCLSEILKDEAMPLTWNAVPFHPVNNGNEANAPVKVHEVSIGTPWLEALMEMFPESRLIAVGRRAEDALRTIGLEHDAVRHPARGRKREFQTGMTDALRNRATAGT
ncbi:MAG: uracil-DNA glycosylase [Dehalococcoidia bacterium]